MQTSAAVLVLTDMEGSTRLWAERPRVMGDVMATHHAIVRSAITEHGGWRPVDQGEGDAVFGVFDSAVSAVRAVIAFQQRLTSALWPEGVSVKVRVAVHAGEVALHDGNVFGVAVNRCARLRGLAAGGQVLLSAPVHELIRDHLSDLPPGTGLVDLGEHRMKDLTRPERVHQLSIPGLQTHFPPLAGLDRADHNLPVQASSFIGRDREIGELVSLLAVERLVTITGFGGMGKTRLALQVAAEMADGSGAGVWFVDLSGETDVERVPVTIAALLGVGEEGEGALPAVLAYLADKQIMLVMDNCEQLLPQIATLVDRLARGGPGVRVLATSREPLRVGGEIDYALQALPLPPRPASGRLSEAEVARLPAYAAVSLFISRASSARRDFTLTAANAAAVAGVCARLEGLPLALELAAARTRTMSPEALLPRLDQALRLLTSGDRTRPSRQQTLTATIAWSYDALDADEQTLLNRLSIFPGPFTLTAAEAICGPALEVANASGANEVDVLEGIGVLVERSLVRHHPGGDHLEDRYSLLATIREYAAAHMQHLGHTRDLAARHAKHYTQLVTMPAEYTRSDSNLRLSLARKEWTHLLAAADWQHTHGTAADALTSCIPLLSGYNTQELNDEVRRLGERVLSRSGGATGDRVWTIDALLVSARNVGNFSEARRWAARALKEAEAVSDLSILAQHLCCAFMMQRSRAAAASDLARLRDLMGTLPSVGNAVPAWQLRVQLTYIGAHGLFVDPEWVEEQLRSALADATNAPVLAYLQSAFGMLLVHTQRFDEAEQFLAPFQAQARDTSVDLLDRVNGLDALAQLRISQGAYEQAADVLDLLLALSEETTSAAWSEASVMRAEVDHLVGDLATARSRLANLYSRAELPMGAQAAAGLEQARLHRAMENIGPAGQALADAWRAVAGEEVQHLRAILVCLLEGATQQLRHRPVVAARLVGLVLVHRGPFLLSPFYSPEGIVAALKEVLDPHLVDEILAEVADWSLPDDPDWPALLVRLGAHADTA